MPAPRGRRGPALPIAALAVLLAVLALGLSGWAVHRANAAVQAAADAAVVRPVPAGPAPVAANPAAPDSTLPGAAPTAEPTGPTVTGEITPSDDGNLAPTGPVTPVPPLNPQTIFEPRFAGKAIRIQPPPCRSRNVDLDAPEVNSSDEAADLVFDGPCNGVPTVVVSLAAGAGAAAAIDPQVTPNECAERMSLSPLDAEIPVAAKQGLVLCVRTSRLAAEKRGDRPRMVVLKVINVSKELAVSMQLNAWDIPS